MKKTPAQLDYEIAEALREPVDPGFEAGFKAGKEQARHDAAPRETLRGLRGHARTDFERGLVAGYENIVSGKAAGSKRSHATAKAEGPWVMARKTGGATVIERQAHGCKLTVTPVDWAQPRGPANWSVTCRSRARADFDHERGQASTVKAAKQAAMRAARAMAVNTRKAHYDEVTRRRAAGRSAP